MCQAIESVSANPPPPPKKRTTKLPKNCSKKLQIHQKLKLIPISWTSTDSISFTTSYCAFQNSRLEPINVEFPWFLGWDYNVQSNNFPGVQLQVACEGWMSTMWPRLFKRRKHSSPLHPTAYVLTSIKPLSPFSLRAKHSKRSLSIRGFHKRTELTIFSLFPTSYSQKNFRASFVQFLSNGTSKTKLAKLAFLYCEEFVKTSIELNE